MERILTSAVLGKTNEYLSSRLVKYDRIARIAVQKASCYSPCHVKVNLMLRVFRP